MKEQFKDKIKNCTMVTTKHETEQAALLNAGLCATAHTFVKPAPKIAITNPFHVRVNIFIKTVGK